MRWPELATISTIISAAAFFLAVWAHRANLRLAQKIANQAGRLHSVNIIRANDPESANEYTELVAVNGPSDVTVTNIALVLTYYHPVGRFAVQQVTVYFEDFNILQKELQLRGPLPRTIRVKPYDIVVWQFPRWDRLLCRGDGLAYRFTIDTAHTDKPADSDVVRFGTQYPKMSSSRILGLTHGKPGMMTFNGGLSSIIGKPFIPAEMSSWAQAVLASGERINE